MIHVYNLYFYRKLIPKKKPNEHFLAFKGPLNLCFILHKIPQTFLNGLITLGILSRSNVLWYSIIVCITKMNMKILIANVLTNGRKHLHFF